MTGSSAPPSTWHRRADRRQHHRVAAAARVAPCRRGGRPVRRAAEAAGARPACAASARPAAAADSADRRRRDRSCRRRLGADPRRRQPRPALFGDGLRRARHRRGSPTGWPQRSREGMAKHCRSGRQRRGSGGSVSTTPSRRGSKPPSIRPSRISTPWTPLSSPWPGLRSIPSPAAPPALAARTCRPRPGSWRRARRGSAGDRLLHRQLPVDRRDQRLGDIGEDRIAAGRADRAGEPAVRGQQDHRRHRRARPLARRHRIGRRPPCLVDGRKEKSVIWLLRKKPSTIRPLPKMDSTVVVIDTTLPAASRTMKCEVPVGSSVGPRPSAPFALPAPAAGRRSPRSAAGVHRHRPGRACPRPAPSRTPDRRHSGRGRRT